jgi:DNA mismatch repair protein MutS
LLPVSIERWDLFAPSAARYENETRPDLTSSRVAISRRDLRTLQGLEELESGMDTAITRKIIEPDRARMSLQPKASARPHRYYSILFERPDDRVADDELKAPDFFVDLNCDQIVDAITAGKDEYNLKPFFHTRLRRIEAINYRHEVMRDLENEALLEQVRSFAQRMRDMRHRFGRSQKLHYKEHKQAWFLDAVETLCGAVNSFADALSDAKLQSRGFQGFRNYLMDYVRSVQFTGLLSQTNKLRADLAIVKYCVLIKSGKFTVRKYEEEVDYSADVEATFEKFKQGAVKDYGVKFPDTEDMNHIEAKILEFVAKLYPEAFLALDEYCTRNSNYVDDTISAFDREIQFYLAYLEYTADLKRVGLRFCYPRVSDTSKEVYDQEGFDIALARKLGGQGASVVCNDFYLRGRERILVVSGPNQGGKTTFARTFGQLHYLASIGCPVPGKEAQLFLFDNLYTHFEKEEKVENLRGKLEDDLVRIHHILAEATPRSVIIMNEIFTSTTIQDEIFLSKKTMEKISALDLLCVWVTFVDELASYGPQTVSMVSTVVPENPASRTFKIVRQPADGLAYAMAIAQKYRLTYDSIMERIS